VAARWSLRAGPDPLWRWRDLAVVPGVVGPHARLGVVWAGLVCVALAAGPLAMAGLLAPVAALAALQAARSWRRLARRAAAPLAATAAAAIVVASAAGPAVVAATAAAVLVVLLAATLVGALAARKERRADPVLTAGVALLTGLAAGAPVLLRRDSLVLALVLVAFAAVHDAAAYIVGTGAQHAWEGPIAAMLSIGAVTLAVAAILVPPFRGASPWVLGAVAAVAAPLGPMLGSVLLGNRRARAPALRRLDSLLVLGPVWALTASLLLP